MLYVIGLLFLIPAHYVLKGKGYRSGLIIWGAIIAGAAIFGTGLIQLTVYKINNTPLWNFLCVFIGFAVLGIAYLLPTRKGAPGMSYLKIKFPCPHCREVIVFSREREGLAEMCPLCGEIVTVPDKSTAANT